MDQKGKCRVRWTRSNPGCERGAFLTPWQEVPEARGQNMAEAWLVPRGRSGRDPGPLHRASVAMRRRRRGTARIPFILGVRARGFQRLPSGLRRGPALCRRAVLFLPGLMQASFISGRMRRHAHVSILARGCRVGGPRPGPTAADPHGKTAERCCIAGAAEGLQVVALPKISTAPRLCESFLTMRVDSSRGAAYNPLHRRRRRADGLGQTASVAPLSRQFEQTAPPEPMPC